MIGFILLDALLVRVHCSIGHQVLIVLVSDIRFLTDRSMVLCQNGCDPFHVHRYAMIRKDFCCQKEQCIFIDQPFGKIKVFCFWNGIPHGGSAFLVLCLNGFRFCFQ